MFSHSKLSKLDSKVPRFTWKLRLTKGKAFPSFFIRIKRNFSFDEFLSLEQANSQLSKSLKKMCEIHLLKHSSSCRCLIICLIKKLIALHDTILLAMVSFWSHMSRFSYFPLPRTLSRSCAAPHCTVHYSVITKWLTQRCIWFSDSTSNRISSKAFMPYSFGFFRSLCKRRQNRSYYCEL